MSEVIRYVKAGNRKVKIKEVFLKFFPLKGKKAADLASEILQSLERDGLDIVMCRSQGYDNAANMAGIHGGVQAIIKAKNKKAIFSGCIDHSLNLCGQHSFTENSSCATFFGTIEAVYSFFSASTHRWDVLIAHTGMSLKRLSATRWSAHYTAVKAVKEKFEELVLTIEALCDPEENLDTRGSAQCLLVAVCDFTFMCYLHFWCTVLEEVNAAQLYLQTKGLSLDKVSTKLETLRLFLQEERCRLVENAIGQALIKSHDLGIPVERRVRLKKGMPGEQQRDAALPLREENKRAMLDCIDRFHAELQTRSKAIHEIAILFEPLEAKSLICATQGELEVSIPKLTAFYDEIPEGALVAEILRLRRHLRVAGIDLEEAKDWGPLDFLKFITEWDFVDSLATLSLGLQLSHDLCVRGRM